VLPLSQGNSLLSNQVVLSAETHHNKIVCKNTQKDQVLFLDAIMRGEGLRVASDTLTKFLTRVLQSCRRVTAVLMVMLVLVLMVVVVVVGVGVCNVVVWWS